MFRALVAMLRRWFGGATALSDAHGGAPDGSDGASDGEAPSALDLMQQMKADRAKPADRASWREGMATFKGRVFSGMDRARLWKRARRKHPGEVLELDLVTQPTTHDLAALQDLLRELERA